MSTPLIHLAPAAPAAAPVDGPTDGTQRQRRVVIARITRIVSIVVTLAALAILLRRVDLPAALRIAVEEPWPPLVAAIAVNVVATWLRATRSQTVLSVLGHRIPFLRMAAAQLAGQVLSWVSPVAAGDFVRPYLWRRHDGVPLTPGVVTVLYERIFSFGQLVVLGAVCAAPLVAEGPELAGAAAAGLVLLALPWLVVRLVRRGAPAAGGFAASRGWRDRLIHAAGQLWRLGGDGRLTARFTLLTIAVVTVSGFQIALLADGVGVTLPLWFAAAAFALSQVVGSVSSLPFGIGPADAVLLAFLVHTGASAEDALAITLLTRLAVTVPLGLVGAVAYLRLSSGGAARAAAS
ncbi:MAG: flippase-like domain-containing protein [Candidatus Dormibacteraeota bacterium]|nr:flippase-like domain-containing protein [Candidatus Dormibacteraeota bacterium]